jgi:hypothetical protein
LLRLIAHHSVARALRRWILPTASSTTSTCLYVCTCVEKGIHTRSSAHTLTSFY